MAFSVNFDLVGPYQSCAAGATGSTEETISIPATGVYVLAWKAEVPTVVGGGGQSGLVVRVRNTTTSTNIFLGVAGVCSGGSVEFTATAADAIAVNLSSTAAADLVSLNCIKCTVSCSSGVA
jgi:activator of 2-hydroxyglutaryl-CoA dehydratase